MFRKLAMRLLVVGVPGRSAPDPVLIKLIVRAQLLRNKLVQDQVGVGELMRRLRRPGSRLLKRASRSTTKPGLRKGRTESGEGSPCALRSAVSSRKPSQSAART